MKEVSLLFIFYLLSSFSNAAVVNTGAILGCSPLKTGSGFNVKYYDYPFAPSGSNPCYNTAYTSNSYLYEGGYETLGKGLLGESSGVTDLTFETTSQLIQKSCTVYEGQLPSNYNYDTDITISNFAMLITGYFYAPTTGSYSFNLDNIDDLAYVNVGAGNAFDCCQRDSSVTYPGNFTLFAEWQSVAAKDSIQVDLVGGVFYPFRLFYVNRDYIGGLSFSFTGPDGVAHSDWTGYIFSPPDLENDQTCDVQPAYSTSGWTNSYTSSYTTVSTYINTEGSTTTGNVIVVETPDIVSTSYTAWTGSSTVTYSTETTQVGTGSSTTQ
ncbi:hypothetical protein AWRI1631_10950010, partial [Saccharomyces cerevisiae AWRI1631]